MTAHPDKRLSAPKIALRAQARLSFAQELRAMCTLSSRIGSLGRRNMLRGLAEINDGRGYPVAKLLAQMDDLQRMLARIRQKIQI